MIVVVLSFAFVFWVAVNLTNPSKEKTLVLQSKAVQTEPAVDSFNETTSFAYSKKSNISMVIMQNIILCMVY